MSFNFRSCENDAGNEEARHMVEPSLSNFKVHPKSPANKLLFSFAPWLCFSLFLHIIIFIQFLKYAEIFAKPEVEITGINLEIIAFPARKQSDLPPTSAGSQEEITPAVPEKGPTQNDENSTVQPINGQSKVKEDSIKKTSPKSKKPASRIASSKESLPKSGKPEPRNGSQKSHQQGNGNAGLESPAQPRQGNRQPVYPKLARKRGIEGEALLKITVTAAGTVARIEILKSSGSSLLDDAALNTVRTWQFHPALKNGSPIESSARIPIRFKLN